jgi:uncharacterized protein
VELKGGALKEKGNPAQTINLRDQAARAEQGNPALLGALASPATYPSAPSVVVHETHASWVFVAGERTYKIKKPLALGFLDYSTLSRRHCACREEVRVNRELAPGVYLGVCAIVETGTGFRLAPEGTPGALEYAVEMRSFREAETVEGLIASRSLTREHVRAIARRLAAFHRAAQPVAGSGVAGVREMWRANLRELARASHSAGWDVELAASFGEAFVRAYAHEIERRRLAGLIRDGHGDLRCEHVLAVGAVRVVDRVEFDPALRHIDVGCDLAFLAMDLEAHDQRWAAEELITAYRRTGVSPGSDALRSFYAARWALVRAKVALIAAGEHEGDAHAEHIARAQALWALGERLCWRARQPVAVVLCGPAASGKSTLATELSRRSGIPVVSSDVVRKSVAGLAPTARAGPEHYGERFTRMTYARLGREAERALRRESAVILDATCRSRSDRALLLAPLRGAGLVGLVVRCEVPLTLAVERARRRSHLARHVSDATPEIVAEQFRSFEPLDELPTESVLALDTDQPLDAQVREVTQAVDRRLAGRVRRGPA